MTTTKAYRPSTFGLSCSAIVRWCGSRGWNVERVTRLLIALGLKIGPGVKTHLSYGRCGKDVPYVSFEQACEMVALAPLS